MNILPYSKAGEKSEAASMTNRLSDHLGPMISQEDIQATFQSKHEYADKQGE